MTRKQQILAKIRAWIDRQLPRDVLCITVYGINNDGAMTKPFLAINHMEGLLMCKMNGPQMMHLKTDDGGVMVSLHTEQLHV